MKDNLSIVITIIVLVLLMVIFPLYNFFERQDDMSYNLVLKATTAFADEVMENGYIDQDMYDKFVSELGNTGNVYDIELEAHKRILTVDSKKDDQYIYINQDYIDYNDDIFESIENENTTGASNLMQKTLKNKVYKLNEKDQFYVKVKNSNTTMAGALFNVIVPTSKKTRISINYGGIIKNNAWKMVDATINERIVAPSKPEIRLGDTLFEDSQNQKNISLADITNNGFTAKSTIINNQTNLKFMVELSLVTSELNPPSLTGSAGTTTQDGSYMSSTITIDGIQSLEGKVIKMQVYGVNTDTSVRSDVTTLVFKVSDTTDDTVVEELETGDLNGDSKIDENDSYKLGEYLKAGSTTTLTDEEQKAADINGDNIIDLQDLDYLVQLIQNGYILGDVNQDKKVDQSDIDSLSNYLVGKATEINNDAANVDKTNIFIDNNDLTALDKLISREKNYVLGDVNKNYAIDQDDIDSIKKYLSNKAVFNKFQEIIADVDKSSIVDSSDITALEKILIQNKK